MTTTAVPASRTKPKGKKKTKAKKRHTKRTAGKHRSAKSAPPGRRRAGARGRGKTRRHAVSRSPSRSLSLSRSPSPVETRPAHMGRVVVTARRPSRDASYWQQDGMSCSLSPSPKRKLSPSHHHNHRRRQSRMDYEQWYPMPSPHHGIDARLRSASVPRMGPPSVGQPAQKLPPPPPKGKNPYPPRRPMHPHVVQALHDGRRGKSMPAQSRRLSRADVNRMVDRLAASADKRQMSPTGRIIDVNPERGLGGSESVQSVSPWRRQEQQWQGPCVSPRSVGPSASTNPTAPMPSNGAAVAPAALRQLGSQPPLPVDRRQLQRLPAAAAVAAAAAPPSWAGAPTAGEHVPATVALMAAGMQASAPSPKATTTPTARGRRSPRQQLQQRRARAASPRAGTTPPVAERPLREGSGPFYHEVVMRSVRQRPPVTAQPVGAPASGHPAGGGAPAMTSISQNALRQLTSGHRPRESPPTTWYPASRTPSVPIASFAPSPTAA